MESDRLSQEFRALAFVGSVRAVRQEYAVYRAASGDFMVFSPSSRGPSSFHLTLIPRDWVEVVGQTISGQGATSSSILEEKKVVEVIGKRERAPLRFEVLMTLYVLTAAGTLEMEKSGRSLLFRRTHPR